MADDKSEPTWSRKQVFHKSPRKTFDTALAEHVAGVGRDSSSRAVADWGQVLEEDIDGARALLQKKLAARRKKRGAKPDHVQEMVFSGPPPYWHPERWSEQIEGQWAYAVYDWVKSVIGDSKISVAAWHRDESTPHVQVLFVPIGPRGNLGWKDVQNAAAERLLGRPARSAGEGFRALHDDLYEKVSSKFGLLRGTSTKGRQVIHTALDPAKRFEANLRVMQAEEVRAVEDRVVEAKGELGDVIAGVATAHDELAEVQAARAQAGEDLAETREAKRTVVAQAERDRANVVDAAAKVQAKAVEDRARVVAEAAQAEEDLARARQAIAREQAQAENDRAKRVEDNQRLQAEAAQDLAKTRQAATSEHATLASVRTAKDALHKDHVALQEAVERAGGELRSMRELCTTARAELDGLHVQRTIVREDIQRATQGGMGRRARDGGRLRYEDDAHARVVTRLTAERDAHRQFIDELRPKHVDLEKRHQALTEEVATMKAEWIPRPRWDEHAARVEKRVRHEVTAEARRAGMKDAVDAVVDVLGAAEGWLGAFSRMPMLRPFLDLVRTGTGYAGALRALVEKPWRKSFGEDVSSKPPSRGRELE